MSSSKLNMIDISKKILEVELSKQLSEHEKAENTRRILMCACDTKSHEEKTKKQKQATCLR